MTGRALHYQEYHGEWRVYFGLRKPFIETASYSRVSKWQDDNCVGERGVDFAISHYGEHCSFLREEDALLCFLAFR